ncbi:UNVERIFIED_CONTAM: hypothetical protein Slati_2754200 [Sesamum latifolium]|uniref:RNase H type-1 domain-containing protein n=1 Tax=Sesamum latifolium TaxID=2727402 RepID=A0AAW2VWT7_9LAMI
MRQDHLQDRRKIFERLKRYQLKINLLKCAFGVTSGKFLGFIVCHRGIEIVQAKIDVILKMSGPQNIQDKFARKVGVPLKKHKVLFDETSYVGCTYARTPTNPLYSCSRKFSGALLAQENDEGKEKWELCNDLPDENVLVIEVTSHWKMYFDGASQKKGAGAGVIFITSDGEVLPYSFILTQNCSNNIAEYQTLILGLKMTLDIKQLHLKVFGDSKLVINQLLELYEVKKLELFSYFNYTHKLIGWLGDVEIEHVKKR